MLKKAKGGLANRRDFCTPSFSSLPVSLGKRKTFSARKAKDTENWQGSICPRPGHPEVLENFQQKSLRYFYLAPGSLEMHLPKETYEVAFSSCNVF